MPTSDHDLDADRSDSESSEDVHDISLIQDRADVDNCHDASKSAILFLDVTDEDVNDEHAESILSTIKRLTVDAKKYKSFRSLFHLNALEQSLRHRRNISTI